jgi:hypothetical protein
MKDEKKQKRKGKWLAPTNAYWNQHKCVTPMTFSARKPKSDRWACFCNHTYTYNYATSEWVLDQ